MNVLKKIFEYLLPVSRRERPEPRPEVNDAVMARLSDHDPLYRAICDEALGKAQEAARDVAAPGHGSEARQYHAGRLYAMMSLLERLEGWRDQARKHAQAEERRKQTADKR